MSANLKDKKLLVIVESPNKCRNISEYLKGAGYKNVTVAASVGHIARIKNNKKSYKNTGVYPDEDFRVEYEIIPEKKDIVDRLKLQAGSNDYVFLMTDPDREGAFISWSLIQFLKLKEGKYFRAVTHEITPKAVVHAIENPIPLENNLIESQKTRSSGDIMIGYGLTNEVKTYLGAKSAGRVQSAVNKIIVDREKEIQNFIPETYIDLYLNFSKNGADFKAKYIGTDTIPVQHLSHPNEVKVVKYKCSGDYIIKNVTNKKKQESPKPPFNTVTFQQEAASKLGMSIKTVMDIAQLLFAHGHSTYMRTDDTEFSPEFLEKLKEYVTKTYNTFNKPKVAKKSGTEQCGHECLRVTDPEMTPEKFKLIDPNEMHQKIYNLIWQRTIASVLDNRVISETTYNIKNNDQNFVFVSNEVVSDGYRVVYNYQDTAEDAPVKETFALDEILQNCTLEDVKKQTTPPPRFTEASLVAELKAKDIGRPSTYESAVENAISPFRGLATVEGKKITATDLGIQLANFFDRAFPKLINLNYTRELESQLDKVASGEADRVTILRKLYNDLELAIQENERDHPKPSSNKVCPKCGAQMVIRRSKFKKLFYGCSRWPNCDGIINIK